MYLQKISKTYNIFFIDFQGLFILIPLIKQSTVLILAKQNALLKRMPVWGHFGCHHWWTWASAKKCFLKFSSLIPSLEYYFPYWKEKCRKILKSVYIWHHKSLFLRKLKFVKVGRILSSKLLMCIIFQYKYNFTKNQVHGYRPYVK